MDSLCEPNPTLIELYNSYNAQAWDDIRDFLAGISRRSADYNINRAVPLLFRLVLVSLAATLWHFLLGIWVAVVGLLTL